MALELAKYPNILFWNSGNENHPTAGYNDKVLMDRYLAVARERLRGADPDRRPVTYANLDTFGNFWFFTAGQDVLGYNSYQFIPEFKTLAANIYQRTKMPIVFCEWGFTENQTKGTRYRNENVEKWEREMREKLSLMRQCPGVVGGFLFPHHGELEDVRGREFLQEIMAPFKLTCENDSIKFENQDVAPLRKVSLLLVSPDNVISSEWADELKPGRSLRDDYNALSESEKAMVFNAFYVKRSLFGGATATFLPEKLKADYEKDKKAADDFAASVENGKLAVLNYKYNKFTAVQLDYLASSHKSELAAYIAKRVAGEADTKNSIIAAIAT